MANTKSAKKAPANPAPAKAAKTPGKNEKVIALLRRDGGASLLEITKATGWQPHSARAVLTGFRKKGHSIEKTKIEGVTHWSIAKLSGE
jgi:hypothetical protein